MSMTRHGEKAHLHQVGIVDDHTLMREGIQLFIDSLPGFACIWTAGSAREAMGKLEQTPLDVLVVDISLPDRNGLELVKDIVAMKPDLPVMVLSMHDEKLYALRALRAGAKGYVMKNASHQAIEASLRRVASGGIGVSAAVSEMIIGAYSSGGKLRPEDGLESLSDREFEIFQMIGDGRSTVQIAESLRISPKTVDVHRMNIRTKLNLEDGAALTRWAIQWTESKRHERR